MNQPQDPQPAPAPKAPRAARKAAVPKAAAAVVAEAATPAPAVAKKRRAQPAAAAKAAKPAKRKPVVVAEQKPPKVKLVRDSFTIPADEYEVLGALKQRASKAGHPVKKSELLRGGIRLLAALSDEALLAALAGVPSIKTGRPKGAKKAD